MFEDNFKNYVIDPFELFSVNFSLFPIVSKVARLLAKFRFSVEAKF
jgi:hypothetical protein